MKLLNLLIISILLIFFADSAISQSPTKLSIDRSQPNSILRPFYHGVASGDPLSKKVIIWTRVTPDDTSATSIRVDWEIARDTNFTQVVNSGTFTTDQSRDYTVKVDVDGLKPDTYYYYRFKAKNRFSPMGRTKTAPSGNVNNLRFAVTSCANYADGFFNAYNEIVQRNDVDAIIHLGDYIYEYGNTADADSLGRPLEPDNELLSLADYRMRYSLYRLDPDLRAAHQQYPWITVWDDHESANNSWVGGAENHNQGEGSWNARKNAAKKAYFEWLPVREQPANPDRVYRTIQYGNLVDLIMMDTRLAGRDEQVSAGSQAIEDTSRTILGKPQFAWLMDQLDSSDAQWKVLGQQVMMAPLQQPQFLGGNTLNTDQWDGYVAERKSLLNNIMQKTIQNVVVITGDIHTSWANDLPLEGKYDDDADTGSAAVEFVTTSITSQSTPFPIPSQLSTSLIQQFNPHIQYTNLEKRGYVILDINQQRAQADWYHLSTVQDTNYNQSFASAWEVKDQNRFIEEISSPSSGDDSQPLAPLYPDNPVGIEDAEQEGLVMMGGYPNPFQNYLHVQYFVEEPNKPVSFLIHNLQGQLVHQEQATNHKKGLYQKRFHLPELPTGQYIVTLRMNTGASHKKVTKVK